MSTVAGLKWAWENRHDIKEVLSTLKNWFKGTSGQPGILIVGPGGVGKTTLAQILAGEHDFLFDSPGEYVESLSVEKFLLKSDAELEILVLPGQKHRREATWTDFEKDIVGNQFKGIIQIVSYGYHSLGKISYTEHRLWRGNKSQFLSDYLEEQRHDELEALQRIVNSVELATNKMWLLTLVTKEDLWFEQKKEVQEYYKEGEFSQLLSSIHDKRGHRNFRQETVFGSLVIRNFSTGNNEMLQKNTAGYDHHCQATSIRAILETVNSLRVWE